MLVHRIVHSIRGSAWLRFCSAVCAISLLPALLSSCGSGRENEKAELTATVSMTPQHLMVNNGDAYVWENAKVIVNGSYAFELAYVPRGSISLNLSDFRKRDGTAFRPDIDRLRRVEIFVPDASGGKEGYYRW